MDIEAWRRATCFLGGDTTIFWDFIVYQLPTSTNSKASKWLKATKERLKLLESLMGDNADGKESRLQSGLCHTMKCGLQIEHAACFHSFGHVTCSVARLLLCFWGCVETNVRCFWTRVCAGLILCARRVTRPWRCRICSPKSHKSSQIHVQHSQISSNIV